MKNTSKRTSKRQAKIGKPLYHLDLPHPLLKGNFGPDVRPFEWPRRPRRTRREIALEIGLFDWDLIQFFRDLDNYGRD
jgi:hypothetical protein